MASLTTSLPSWLLFLVTFLVGIVVAETGAWLARRRERKGKAEKEAPVGTLIGALLGLLAFMLGFTFSFTASRFSERKHLVVEQAKAIGTCYLRTSFIPEEEKQQTRKLLYQYTDLLINTSSSSVVSQDVAMLELIQDQLWQHTVFLKDKTMDPPLRALYVASVNQVIDVFGERKAVVLVFRIPGALWVALLLLYILSMFVVGSEISSFKLRRSLNVPIMTAAFALIVVLIAAMDASNRRGHFTVSQQPLVDVRDMMKAQVNVD